MSDPCASVPDVEAVAWTAIGVLAVAVLGWWVAFLHLKRKISAFETRLNARIDAFGADLRAHIDALTTRVDEYLGHAG